MCDEKCFIDDNGNIVWRGYDLLYHRLKSKEDIVSVLNRVESERNNIELKYCKFYNELLFLLKELFKENLSDGERLLLENICKKMRINLCMLGEDMICTGCRGCDRLVDDYYNSIL